MNRFPSLSPTRRVGLAAIAAVALVLGACSSPPGVAVDQSRLPAKTAGFSGPRITRATYAKYNGEFGVGAFRVNCSLSHMAFDDPIVNPGAPGTSHLHAFFGNNAVDAYSTTRSITTRGNSTCTGGTLNRTGYWAPAVIDTRTNRPVLPWGENGLQAYYKTGYRGVDPKTIVAMPAGLRMIAGSAKSTSPQPNGIVNYSCDGRRPVAPQASFPNCSPGDRLLMAVEFPQCWDGKNLDSPDHKSHMAYGQWRPNLSQPGGCPRTHPVAIPSITQNFRYTVPSTGMSSWRLASDTYSGPAGYSGHADWWNGWDPATFDRVVRNCLRGGFDCQMNLLGDGQMLH